jgi:HlyD family secretion protein
MARARQSAAIARAEEAQVRLEQLTIRAPIAGEALQVKFRAGEYYQPGGDPLIILGDTRTLRARIDVDERDVLRVKIGADAFITLNAYPGRRIPAKVVEIGRRMGRKNVRTDDPVERIDTKILEVVIELQDKAGLVPGLRVVGYIARSG